MSSRIVIIGAGPAGLAAAIHLARRNLPVTVLEQQSGPPDKACGEGLMPAGLAQLTALGVRERLGSGDCHPIRGIRYIQEDGSAATGVLPSPGGLGIRRTILTRELAATAVAEGAEIVWGCRVRNHEHQASGVHLTTDQGTFRADLLVAADGLHSPIRDHAGLSAKVGGRRRFGLRRHYRVRPTSDLVEVHLAPGREAFITPVAPDLMGVAFLWDDHRYHPTKAGATPFATLLASFPLLAERFATCEPANNPQGAGPHQQKSRGIVADRLVLIGDAAGYLDPITGEGISLALASAAALGACAPKALEDGAGTAVLQPYAKAHAQLYRRYAWVTGAVLGLAGHPRLRRPLVRWLGAHPRQFDRLMAWALG